MKCISKLTGRIISLAALLIISLMLPHSVSAQEEAIRINEFMALNQSTIMDRYGDYSDWIELFNPTSEDINLKGWSLTDDKNDPGKWVFPEIIVTPGEYLVIFASNKDRTRPKKELHTNFKLSGNGEYLGLYDSNGNPITEFSPAFPEQQVDTSFGYVDGTYKVCQIPTPTRENE